jgi:hypothetical protein
MAPPQRPPTHRSAASFCKEFTWGRKANAFLPHLFFQPTCGSLAWNELEYRASHSRKKREDCNASDWPRDLTCPRLNTLRIYFRIQFTSGEIGAWRVRAEVCTTRPFVGKNPTMAISKPRETGLSASGPESPREAESLAIVPATTKSGK